MTLIPFAPVAAPPAAPSAPAASSRDSAALGTVFSALVSALSEEFLEADGESTTAQETPPSTEDVTDVQPTAADAAAVVAMLLAASNTVATTAPAPDAVTAGADAAPSTTVEGIEGIEGDATGTAPPVTEDLTATSDATDLADVVPDSDADPGVGGDTDGPVEATATLEAAVDTGPVEHDVDPAHDGVTPEVESSESGPSVDAANAANDADAADAVEAMPGPDHADPADTLPVTTDADVPDAANPATVGRDAATIRADAGPTDGVAAVGASTSPSPAPAVDGATSAAAPARPVAPAVPDQLVTVLAPLRRGPDGTHRVAIQLRPDELGEVLIDVRVRGNEIALSVRADLPGTVDLLRASVSDLRAQLEAAGFQAGDLDVTGHAPDGAGDDRPGARRKDTDGPAGDRTATGTRGTGPDDAPEAPPSSTHATGLDLRL